MTYPIVISNKDLYSRCDVTPLSERVTKSRWRMLGHILRSDSNSPAQLALSFAVESMNNMKGRLGRHQSNILKRDLPLNDLNDLTELRYLALDRVTWRNMFDQF